MNITETNASETEEGEFYDLLWNKMDSEYSKYPPTPAVLYLEDMSTEPHNNPEVD